MEWSYGLTSCRARASDPVLPRTLVSLAAAGFDKPRIFWDDLSERDKDNPWWAREYAATYRTPKVTVVMNWWLAAVELYGRNPWADRYALFQDDFVTVRGLRGYLEKCPYPGKGYCNLYTFPSNHETRPVGQGVGWAESNPLRMDNTGNPERFQSGRGAVALVFDNEAMRALLSHPHMVKKVADRDRGWRSVDGAIVTAMNLSGFREFVHHPSLTQHTGDVSAMGNRPHPKAIGFPGENFDATNFLPTAPPFPGE